MAHQDDGAAGLIVGGLIGLLTGVLISVIIIDTDYVFEYDTVVQAQEHCDNNGGTFSLFVNIGSKAEARCDNGAVFKLDY